MNIYSDFKSRLLFNKSLVKLLLQYNKYKILGFFKTKIYKQYTLSGRHKQSLQYTPTVLL